MNSFHQHCPPPQNHSIHWFLLHLQATVRPYLVTQLKAHEDEVNSACFSPNSQEIASVSSDRSIHIFPTSGFTSKKACPLVLPFSHCTHYTHPSHICYYKHTTHTLTKTPHVYAILHCTHTTHYTYYPTHYHM